MTLNATLAHVKRFFHWLAGQPGYKSRLQYSDADYFNLSEKDVRVATARRKQAGPTLDQVKHVIAMMPADGEIERRNRNRGGAVVRQILGRALRRLRLQRAQQPRFGRRCAVRVGYAFH